MVKLTLSAQLPTQTYSSVAKWLHWLTALAILLLLAGGPLFHFLPEPEKVSRAASGHAGLGTLVLLLISVRLIWRYRHPVLPPVMPKWQTRISLLVHRLLYICVLLQPMLGIAMAMTSSYDVIAFGRFNYTAVLGPNETWYQVFHVCHRVNGAVLALTLLLHIAAVIYHQFIVRDQLLSRMLPRGRGDKISNRI